MKLADNGCGDATRFVTVERAESELFGADLSMNGGEHGQEGMATIDLVRTVTAEDDGGHALEPLGKGCEERARRFIGPMQVVIDHQNGADHRHPLEEIASEMNNGTTVAAVGDCGSGDSLDRLPGGAFQFRRSEIGEESANGGRHLMESGERAGFGAKLVAAAAEYGPAFGVGIIRYLGGETRLAHAGFAGNEDGHALASLNSNASKLGHPQSFRYPANEDKA